MQIFGTMEKGNLVPDEVVIDLLAEAMAKESTGFLVDGFPATMEQAQLFEQDDRQSGEDNCVRDEGRADE